MGESFYYAKRIGNLLFIWWPDPWFWNILFSERTVILGPLSITICKRPKFTKEMEERHRKIEEENIKRFLEEEERQKNAL